MFWKIVLNYLGCKYFIINYCLCFEDNFKLLSKIEAKIMINFDP